MSESGWQPIGHAPRVGSILLLLGETIPDVPDVRVGGFIDGAGAAHLGYDELSPAGGWITWLNGSDFDVIAFDDPLGWAPLPEEGA